MRIQREFRPGELRPRRRFAGTIMGSLVAVRGAGCAFALLWLGAAISLGEEYFPPAESAGGWRNFAAPNAEPTKTQKEQIRSNTGLDWERLNEAWEYDLNRVGIEKEWPGNPRKSLLVIRRGWIAFERYFSPDGRYDQSTRAAFASGTKTLVGVSLARLFTQGRCRDTDPLSQYLPSAWAEAEPARTKIQIRHALSMSSGLEPFDGPYEPATYARIIRNLAVIAEPGTQWFYNTGALDLLNYVIRGCSGQTMQDFLNAEIMAPIGGGTVYVEPRHTFDGNGFCSFYRITPRDYARIGYLFLHRGCWAAEQLIAPEFVDRATSQPPWLATARVGSSAGNPSDANENYGYTFWLNRTREKVPAFPPDAFMASGGNHKMIVVPSLDLVVVRVGNYVHEVAGVNEVYRILRDAVIDQPAEKPPAAPSVPPPAAATRPASPAGSDFKAIPSGRHLHFEAEDGICTPPMRIASTPDGTRFAWVPREAPANYDVPGGPGAVAFAFHLPTSGAYNIWIRTITPDAHSDSCFLSLDGQIIERPWNTEMLPQSRDWRWHKLRDGRKVEAGNHVLEIRHRESGVKLDQIVITADRNFTP